MNTYVKKFRQLKKLKIKRCLKSIKRTEVAIHIPCGVVKVKNKNCISKFRKNSTEGFSMICNRHTLTHKYFSEPLTITFTNLLN